jgi:hypothetical protein
VKGAPHPDAAKAWLDFIHSPEALRIFVAVWLHTLYRQLKPFTTGRIVMSTLTFDSTAATTMKPLNAAMQIPCAWPRSAQDFAQT